MANIFEQVSVPRRGRSRFNLSHSRLLTLDFGQLIPVCVEEVIPGDHMSLATEVVLRMQPLVSPVLHAIYLTVHWFFVPFRILWSDWVKFITGDVSGNDATALPRFNPNSNAVGTIWDYMGMPTGITPDADNRPLAFPFWAYNMIYNEFYRDETLIAEKDIDVDQGVWLRSWRKDYFTSALTSQQRGTAPALPISGVATWAAASIGQDAPGGAISPTVRTDTSEPYIHINNAQAKTNLLAFLNANTMTGSPISVNDLRVAVATQRWKELNARGGVRYFEWLESHFGQKNPDASLQRPQYLGGFRAPVTVSEVLQTSQTTTGAGGSPQGKLAGHGITADRQFCGSLHAGEFGVLMAIMSVMPEAMYSQGIDRQWNRHSRYDYYDPMWAGLSEQAIARSELYATNVKAENETIFGYQGRFDELRIKSNKVCGQMRDTFDYWHLARQFSGAPLLNQSFIELDAVTDPGNNPYKRIFAVPSEPGMVAHVGNIIDAVRMVPAMAVPGDVGTEA